MVSYVFAILLSCAVLAAQTKSDGPQYNAEGQLLLPQDYRQWVYLSSGLGMTYGPAAEANQNNPMFDNVFVNPSSYRAFLETGRWPDKTMFVLEIRRATEKGSINNAGRFQSGVVVIEASVKDEARFPNKWAYIDFAKGTKATPLPQNSQCNSCHSQHGAVDNTFVQFYPTLLEIATKKGTLNPSYKSSP